MTARTAALVLLAGSLLGGCAVPRWVPFFGKSDPPARPLARTEATTPATGDTPARERPGLFEETVADRVVAVVNNDAITLGELLESIVHHRHENRQRTSETDEELARAFLNQLIDQRLQLQEAEREKIVVEEQEVQEEISELAKKLGAANVEAFEEMAKAQGLSPEAVRKRTRERIRTAKVTRRKINLRISVTEPEIDRYIEQNRAKLETGLAYHAYHILLVPENATEAGWESARERAEAIRAEALGGASFTDLARQHSGDASARDGGDLGTLKRGELAQEIEAQILALNPGDISRPYRSGLGWHLFRLESKEGLEGEALARARRQIGDILFREKYDVRREAWLNELKKRAIIDVRL